MKKYLLALLGVVVVCAICAGCGGKTEDENAAKPVKKEVSPLKQKAKDME